MNEDKKTTIKIITFIDEDTTSREKQMRVDFVYLNLARTFEAQSKELIANNLDQFYRMGHSTGYLTLLTILADFNKNNNKHAGFGDGSRI